MYNLPINLPLMFLLLSIDGAGNWGQFWYITMPMLKPIFTIILVLNAGVASATVEMMILFGTGGGPAEAVLTTATADELVARETHDKTMECIEWRGKTICPGLGPYEERARYSLQAATEALKAAQSQLAALQAGAAERIAAADAAVEAATAQRDAAQAQLDLLRAGATDEEIAAQQAIVAQAQAALDEAQVALERAEVRAPFAGTVGMVDTRVGESVVPGQPLVTLGDLSTLRVETTDLDEIDVARVMVGQQVDVTFDALPEVVFTGEVIRISPMAASGSGGVNYTVVIAMDEIDPAVRWGMTAFVDIEVGQ